MIQLKCRVINEIHDLRGFDDHLFNFRTRAKLFLRYHLAFTCLIKNLHNGAISAIIIVFIF